MPVTTEYIELYSNKMGRVCQNDRNHTLLIEFAGTETSLNIPCFFCLKKVIDRIDLDAMANNLETDVEIVNPCSCDRLFVLTLSEAYYFQDLLTGTKVMLELNSIIHERLFSYSFC